MMTIKEKSYMNDIIDGTNDPLTAGLLCLAMTAAMK